MPNPSMPALRAARHLALPALLAWVLLAAGPPAARAADEARSETWYTESQDGHKTGYRRVVWSPSTWKGRKTLHDTTTVVSRTVRNMAGMRDVFQTTVTSDLERGEDGTLWWMQTRVEEAGRVQLSETVWTGQGYRHAQHIIGQEENRETFDVPLPEPVLVDAESVLGPRIRAGTLKAGDAIDIRQLDLRARKARTSTVTVVARETIQDERGQPLETWKVLEVDPASRTEMSMWIDDHGAFVRVRAGSSLIERTTQEQAEQLPTRAAEYSITVAATPRLERIFSADRVRIDVHIRPDEHRKLPEFPESPWSRTKSVEDLGADGQVAHVELTRYDNVEAKASIPVVGETWTRTLEATAEMQVRDPLIQKTAREVVGEEKDARRAAHKLARFVYTKLAKQSLDVAQGDAVQILKECRGDCSEHCLLFVTLCRAAGIPARRCSGYVCIGGLWGSHAWAEIWTGAWIGADPTTGEIGTGARYLFFGYPDEAESYPAVVSARVRGRLRIVTTHLDEGAASFDLTDPDRHRIYDPEGRRYIHVLAGLEARDVPEGWTVDLGDDRVLRIRGDGFSAQLTASADQGEDIDSVGRYFPGTRTTFAGAPALLRKVGATRMYLVHSRRRLIQLAIAGASGETLTQLEAVLGPTFAEPALAWK